jgi:dTDP-4-amino-4,6-dideoxygalactose transaminase
MPVLAINGGKPVRQEPFPQYITIGPEEKKAVLEVLDTTQLSKFIGVWSPDFFGGERVQRLERAWESYFSIKHAVSVNSATSGLYAAVGAAGIGPGDEVIVSPYTMTASATAAVVYGGIPVFADIDPEIFCISPESIMSCITPKTKAIIVVDIFGHPADMSEIMELAHDHDIVVIEDAAQAYGATLNGKYAGTLADMGVFSLNFHKTIHCGEGGIIVTDDDIYAERLQLIRNHAEVIVEDKGVKDLVNMVGFNYRMTEIEAAIAYEQLKKLDRLLAPRIAAANYLSKNLAMYPEVTPPLVRPNTRHGYYVYVIKYDRSITGVHRDQYVAALQAEGIPFEKGYTKPLYLNPMYQQRIAFGKAGYPFTYSGYHGQVRYNRGICPVTERVEYEELILSTVCHADIRKSDLDDVIAAFEKVHNNIKEVAL